MTKTCSVTLCEISCPPSINFTSGSMYCDLMKQAVGVLMSCPLMETEIAPLCLGGMWIVLLWILCLFLTPYLPYNKEIVCCVQCNTVFLRPNNKRSGTLSGSLYPILHLSSMIQLR